MIRFGKIRSHDEAVTGIVSHSLPCIQSPIIRKNASAHNTPRSSDLVPSGSDASRKEKERTIMSNNSSNKLYVPQAKQGMEQFKMLTRQ